MKTVRTMIVSCLVCLPLSAHAQNTAQNNTPNGEPSTKSDEEKANRSALYGAFQRVRGDTGKWNDEAILQLAPSLDQKPAKLSLDDWADQLAEGDPLKPTGNDENWLLFKTRQLDDNDRVWVQQLDRKGDQFTIVLHEAIWQGKYSKTFTYYNVYGLKLGKLKPGKYKATVLVQQLEFRTFDGNGRPTDQRKENWPKDERPADKNAAELSVEFTVEPDRTSQRQQQIDRQLAIWKQSFGKLGTYSYTIQYACECAETESGAVLVRVEQNHAVSARSVPSGIELPDPRRKQFLRTIDDIFGELQTAVKEDVDQFDVVYHPRDGYPMFLAVDPIAEAVDDEYELEILLLQPRVTGRPGAKETSSERAEILEQKVAAREQMFLRPTRRTRELNSLLAADTRRLNELLKQFKLHPDDEDLRQQAIVLVTRLSKVYHSYHQAMLDLRMLPDGMTLIDAVLLLGPPTDRSADRVGWYHNTEGLHVAPYLSARVTKQGLSDWKVTRR